MRKRLVRALIFIAIMVGAGVGIASAAGAFDGSAPTSTGDSVTWE